MADDATIKSGTAGSDIRTATDEAAYDGSNQSHAQLVKLVDGTANSTQRILGGAGTATGALRTTLASDDPAVVSVQIMDDWDESDRAKVNLIAGVAGITAGAGNVASGTPRVTLAADDPAVALLTTIDADTGNLAGILTSVQLIDDAIFAEDVAAQAADKGIAVLAVRRDADTSLVGTDNDYANLQVDSRGALKVEVFSGEALPITDNGGAITVDGSVSVSGTVTVDSELTTADLDTGAGTDTRAVVGLVLAASGGGALVGTANPMPVSDNGTTLSVDDGAGSLTVDNTDITNSATSLAIIDDWDETDRCKVNLIVGVAGITAGAGAVASGTPRVTLASDDPAVSSLATIAALSRAEDAGHSSGHTGIMALAVRNDAGGALAGTDLDYIPLTTDSSGQLRITGTVSAATEYTEDAAAAANPVGGAVILVRADTPATQVSADGDNVAQRGTNYGAAYVQVVTSAGAFVDSFGGGTEYTEDAAAAADPVGKATILVRKDTPATVTSADGDNIAQRGTNYGAAYVQVVNSSGSYVDSFGGGTEYTEDAAAAADPVGKATILVRDDLPVAALTSADGDNVAQRGNNFGGAYVTLMGSDGAAQLPAAAALADNTSNPTTTGVASYLMVFDGSTWDRAPGTSAGGAFVQGPAAHDAAVAGSPLLLGAYADTDADTTAVSADGDAVRLVADLKGRLAVRPIKFTTVIRVNSANLTTASTSYTAGDTLGLASSVPATFASAARVSGGGGIIRGIYVLDKADITGQLTIFVFRASVTLAADNSAWSVSDSDMESCVLRQPIAMTDEGNQRVGFWSGYTPFDCNASDLFVGARTDTAHTFFGAASDIRIALFIEQD